MNIKCCLYLIHTVVLRIFRSNWIASAFFGTSCIQRWWYSWIIRPNCSQCFLFFFVLAFCFLCFHDEMVVLINSWILATLPVFTSNITTKISDSVGVPLPVLWYSFYSDSWLLWSARTTKVGRHIYSTFIW